jgi:hypothetical protein
MIVPGTIDHLPKGRLPSGLSHDPVIIDRVAQSVALHPTGSILPSNSRSSMILYTSS